MMTTFRWTPGLPFFFAVLFGLLVATPAPAATMPQLQQQVDKFCQKIRQCTFAEMEGKPFDESTRKFAEQMVNNICADMKTEFADSAKTGEMVTAAHGCIKSMNALPCNKIDSYTPECEAAHKLVDGVGR